MRALTRIGLAFLLATHLGTGAFSQSGIITTYAGPGLPVDGKQATTQPMDYPDSVAPDGAGGFYIASTFQSKVYRVTADGRLTLVAGNGTRGFGGDGGPAVLAQLRGPSGIAVNAAGDLYISDGGNGRIRKVTSAGVITTVAGPGSVGSPYGIVFDAEGNLYIADFAFQRVRKMTPAGVITTVAGNGSSGFSGDGGPATSAQLTSPLGVAVDSAGSLYIADNGNRRIRKVTSAGVIITVAGDGTSGSGGDGGPAVSAQLSSPSGVAVDTVGNLYIADPSGFRIRKVHSSGVITTAAGNGTNGFSGEGGPATSAQLGSPTGLAVDPGGNLYIADQINMRIRKVTTAGTITTVAGNGTAGFSGDGGPATSAQLNHPFGVDVDAAGNLYIADSYNARVRKVTPAGVITTVAGNGIPVFGGDGGPATSAQVNPFDVAVDMAGNLYIADFSNMRIRKVTPAGMITTVAGNGTIGFSGDGGPGISAQLYNPYGVAVDAAGNLYIADGGNQRIRKVTPGGLISTVAGNGVPGFSGDGGPASSAQLAVPNDVAVDTAGNLYIADNGNMRIRKVTAAGVITTVAGNGTRGFSGDGGTATSAQLDRPSSVTVDTAGNYYIADTGNQRIRIVNSAGGITTLAGNGMQGYSGDGGPAPSAQLNLPYGVAVDAAGNLYFSDQENQRIRKVTASSTGIVTYFPQVAVGNGFSTTFTLVNTGAYPISGSLLLTDQQGNPLIANGSGFGAGSSFPVSIPPGGTTFLTVASLSPNDPQKSGWAAVETSGGLPSGVATYELVQQGTLLTAAGVLASQPTQFATVPVDNDDSYNRFTGYALANPGNQSLVVKLGVVDENGLLVDDSVTITLGPRQQIARFLHQDVNRLKFKGSMVFRGQAGGYFVAIALAQKQQIYTVIPVTSGKAPNIPD